MSKHPGQTLRTRPTLLLRVQAQDPTAWEEFHQLYRRLISGRARRAGLGHADAEDVAQDVFQRVAESIKEFDLNPDRGSFRGWLMKLTQWRIADKFESNGRQPKHSPAKPVADHTLRTATIERVPSPEPEEDEWDREWEEHVLAAGIERLARQVKAQHFKVFDLYVRQQQPVAKVAAQLNLTAASVYVISHRLTKLLKAEVAKLREQMG